MAKGADLENAYALVIGISKYKDPRIPRLNYTRADAEGIFKLLIDPKWVGLKQDKIKLLLDEDAALTNIKKAISSWLFKNADKDSMVFIYFAGHGGVEEDRLGIEKDRLAKYMLPFDADFDDLFASALSNRDFNELLSTIKSKRLLIFLDSCYAGGVSERKARDVKIVEDPYQKLAEGEGRIVIAASQPDQRSFEDPSLEHGVFTYILLEALSGKADYDNDGYVTVFDVYRYLQDAVPRIAMRLTGGAQEPVLRGDITKDFVVSVNRERFEELEKEIIREKKLMKLREFYNAGKLSGKQYEHLHKIVKIDVEKLAEKDKNTVKLIDDIISGDISITTFLDDLKDIKPELFEIPRKEKEREEQERLRREEEEQRERERKEEEKKKQIVELSLHAQRLFEEGNYAEAIAKWQEVLNVYPENPKAIERIKESKRILDEINALNSSAQRLYDEGMYNQAIDKWNRVLNINTRNQIAMEGIKNASNKIESKEVKKYCPSCGYLNERKLKYCTQCGTKLFVI